VKQPPFFNVATRAPASISFALSMKQHTAPGSAVSMTPLAGFSKDPWQATFLRYSWASPPTAPATAALFTIDAVTGNVSLALSE
jgi:hypothetical protein